MEVDEAYEDFTSIRQSPRILEFLTLDGLQRLTGCTPEGFVKFMIKELVDNALDKKNTRNIEVGVIKNEDGSMSVFVADDGEPKFTYESLTKILDFQNAPSSKRGIKRVQRGVLGNALQCCFGVSHALWKDDNRPEYTALVIGEESWAISLKINVADVKPIITPVKFCRCGLVSGVQNLTGLSSLNLHELPPNAIIFKLPIFDYKNPLETIKFISIINPHVTIKFREDEWHNYETFHAFAETQPLPPQKFGDVWWYNFEDFHWLVKEFSEMEVRWFISMFKKLSSVNDVKMRAHRASSLLAFLKVSKPSGNIVPCGTMLGGIFALCFRQTRNGLSNMKLGSRAVLLPGW